MKKNNLIPMLFCILIMAHSIISANTVVLFSHGIADTYKQAFWYAQSYIHNSITYHNERYLFPCPFATFNYPDATEGILRVNYNETSFGQKNEIDRLLFAYNKTVEWSQNHYKEYNIILFGLSRGASNVSIFAGLYNLERVKAIVLESPYCSMEDVIASIMQKINLGWLPVSYGQSIAEFIFKRYKHNGINPSDMIANISKNIPIFIICSKEDQLVPYTSSINLYKKLIKSGHLHTYILILDHGCHAKILSGSDGQKYQATIHAFYKKYNLPHCPSMACKGDFFLRLCQPDLS